MQIVRSYKYAADALEKLEQGDVESAQVLSTIALVGAINEQTEVLRRDVVGMLRHLR